MKKGGDAMTKLLFQIGIGLGITTVGIYEMYAARLYLKQLKTNDNADTSIFATLALWSGFTFGAILILGGLSFLFGAYS